MLSTLYAAIARRRREFYAARPDRRQRLRRPVISVGNIAVGGRGKTPVVDCVARLLVEMGERPAILSRGYGRRRPDDGVVVVRDADGIHADLDRSGDEPLMLARRLPGVAVLVSPDRYVAGRVAEQHLGATVHVLDDGFQHLQLDRDVDLVIVAPEDLAPDARTLPQGRLRELPDALIAADAVLSLDAGALERVPCDPSAPRFRLRRTFAAIDGEPEPRAPSTEPPSPRATEPPSPRATEPPSNRATEPPSPRATEPPSLRAPEPREPVMALAGIAGPERFFEDLRTAGLTVVATAAFRDHYRYSRRDLDRLVQTARAAGAARLVTTEKDYVRLLPFRPFALPIDAVALTMEPDPLPDFRAWLAGAVNAARDVVA